MPSFPPNVPLPPAVLTRPDNDAIARGKRVMALIDAYIDKPTADARCAIRSQLMQEFAQADNAQRAAEKVKAESLARLRDQAALHRLALVPFRMTRPMRDVIEQEDGWDWADVLAAAESVTEESYSLAGMRADELPEKAIDDFIEGYVLEADGGPHVPTDHERFLLKDAMVGLLADPAFTAALAEHEALQPEAARLKG